MIHQIIYRFAWENEPRMIDSSVFAQLAEYMVVYYIKRRSSAIWLIGPQHTLQ